MHKETAEVGRLGSEALCLMGNYEIRALLGVSRQRTYQITRLDSFPAPVAELASGGVWLAADVHDWIAAHRAHLRQARTGAPEKPAQVAAAAFFGERPDGDERRGLYGRP